MQTYAKPVIYNGHYPQSKMHSFAVNKRNRCARIGTLELSKSRVALPRHCALERKAQALDELYHFHIRCAPFAQSMR